MVENSTFRHEPEESEAVNGNFASRPCSPSEASQYREHSPTQIAVEVTPTTTVKKRKMRAGRKAQEEKLRRAQKQQDGLSLNSVASDIRDTAQGGQKLFASKDIKRGTKLIVETPLLALGQNDSFSDLRKNLEALNQRELAKFYSMRQLSDTDTKIGRETVLRLSEDMHVDADCEGNGVSDEDFLSSDQRAYGDTRIFSANMLPITNPDVFDDKRWDSEDHATKDSILSASLNAVFEAIGMIEHSCRPSYCYNWNKATSRGAVHAVRDLKAGEELTISYLENLCIVHKTRRRLLSDKRCIDECKYVACWGFISVSEEVRAKLFRLGEDWDSPKSSAEYDGIPLHIVKQILVLMKAEGLDTSLQMVRRLQQAGTAVCRICAYEEAKLYFGQTLNVARACLGEDNPDFQDIAHKLKLAIELAKRSR